MELSRFKRIPDSNNRLTSELSELQAGAPGASELTARCAASLLGALYAASVMLRLLAKGLVPVPNIFGDELWHIEYGRSVLNGHGLYWGVTPVNHPSWLYPLLISPALHWLWGQAALNGVLVINALSICLTPIFAYGLARWTLSRCRSLVVAGLTSLLVGMAYTSNIMAESIFFPLSVAAFWLGLVALERQSVANRLAAGAIFGLLYHAKPQGLFFPILFALTVTADAAIAASGAERIKKVLMHWLTAAGCAAVLGLRWLEILAFEQQDHPWSISAFLGSYADRAFGDLPFQWAGFGMMLAGHLVVLTISCGILPALNLGPELLSALRGKSAGRRGQLALMAAATVLVTTVASARHTIIADADWSIYERYLMIVHPLLFILFAKNRMKPCSGWVRAGGWLAAVIVLTGAALTAHALQWHLWWNLPSLSSAWLVLDDRQKLGAVWVTTGGLIALPALLLLAQRIRIGRWSFGLRAWTVAWLLLVMNFGYYITAQTVHKPMTKELHNLARQITRVVPKGKRLMIVRDDMPLSLYFQVASRVPEVPVCLASYCDWFIRPLQLSPTAVPAPPGNLGDFWLLTNARWHFIGKPAKQMDHYNLYDLGVYPPPRLSVPQVAVEIARKMPILVSPTVDGFRKEFELSWLDIRLPRSLRAGDTVTVKATVRNDSPFPLGSGVQRLGLGYHWANPELTGNWTAVVWDDGNYTWLPEEMPAGQTMEIAVHVAVPERAGKGWLLTLCPVLVDEHYRLWPDSRRCKSLDGLTIAPNQHPSTG